jgi:hypothetical protein
VDFSWKYFEGSYWSQFLDLSEGLIEGLSQYSNKIETQGREGVV